MPQYGQVIWAEIKGLKEMNHLLRALPSELASRGGGPLRLSLSEGVRVVRDHVEATVPVDKGNLKRSTYMYRDRDPKSRGMTERYTVGFRRGSRNRQGDPRENEAPHGRFVEFGTSKTPAQPRLREGFEDKWREAVRVIASRLRWRLDTLFARLRRRGR